MRYVFCVAIICAVFVINVDDVRAGRGRSSGGSRSRGSGSSAGSRGSGGGWFNWLRGGKSTSTTGATSTTTTTNNRPTISRPLTPSFHHKSSGFPSASQQHGFTTYGRNYATNYYSGHQPVSHPFQSHFQPPTPSIFAYHFIPIPIYHHDYHYYHYYGGGSGSNGATTANRIYYDARNSTDAVSREPILYNYKPPAANDSTSDFSSSEEDKSDVSIHPDDYLIAGMENGLICASIADDQHQVTFIQQESDGVSLEAELHAAFNHIDVGEQPKCFPEVEFRFDSDDEPNTTDLDNAAQMLRDFSAKIC